MKNFSYLLLVLVLLMSCGKKEGDQIADVGIKLNLSLSPDTITDFLYVTMDYEYEILDDFNKIDKDYLVFVHFWRLKSKEMLIQDDHMPVKKTSEWKAGDKVSYSRMFFIPKFLDELDIDFEGFEEIKLQSGLYDPQNPTEKIVLFNQVLNVQPASINAPDIIYSEGWNEEEMNLAISDPFYRVWRWTTKKAECIIENPKKKSVLIIKGGLHKSIFQDQTVILKINDTLLEAFISDSVTFEKKYMLTPEQLGDEPE
ncbi:MAG: hypothetical protein KAS65_08465, partial [Candidatus Aminicenantes bacterium]|nr:hypothetical protein [Candidatus Aminicenantes bacterium]